MTLSLCWTEICAQTTVQPLLTVTTKKMLWDKLIFFFNSPAEVSVALMIMTKVFLSWKEEAIYIKCDFIIFLINKSTILSFFPQVKFNQALADHSMSDKPRLIDGIVLTKFDTIDDKVFNVFLNVVCQL